MSTIALAPVFGTLRTEFTATPAVPDCTDCGGHLGEKHAAQGWKRPVHAVVVRQQSRTNRKLARTVATLCIGCATTERFVQAA